MLCGYPPFYGKTENERVEKILSGHFEFADEVIICAMAYDGTII
jgi:hypothetical protein